MPYTASLNIVQLFPYSYHFITPGRIHHFLTEQPATYQNPLGPYGIDHNVLNSSSLIRIHCLLYSAAMHQNPRVPIGIDRRAIHSFPTHQNPLSLIIFRQQQNSPFSTKIDCHLLQFPISPQISLLSHRRRLESLFTQLNSLLFIRAPLYTIESITHEMPKITTYSHKYSNFDAVNCKVKSLVFIREGINKWQPFFEIFSFSAEKYGKCKICLVQRQRYMDSRYKNGPSAPIFNRIYPQSFLKLL